MKQFNLLIGRYISVLLLFCLWLPSSISAQESQASNILIQGKVTDAKGNGLPGVNVILINSKIGVNTDNGG